MNRAQEPWCLLPNRESRPACAAQHVRIGQRDAKGSCEAAEGDHADVTLASFDAVDLVPVQCSAPFRAARAGCQRGGRISALSYTRCSALDEGQGCELQQEVVCMASQGHCLRGRGETELGANRGEGENNRNGAPISLGCSPESPQNGRRPKPPQKG